MLFAMEKMYETNSGMLTGSDRVRLGAIVTVKRPPDGNTVEYQIVAHEDSDVDGGKISVNSPVAASLIGGREGETVTVRTPGGNFSLEIVGIRYR